MISTAASFRFLAVFLAVLHLIPLANMVAEGSVIPTFAVVDALSLAAFALGGLVLGRRLATRTLSELDMLVLAYLGLSLGSFLLYFLPGHPAPAFQYVYGVHHLVLPMGLYFAVQALDASARLRLTRHLVGWNCAAILIGGLLFFWRPDFYVTFLMEHYQTNSAEDETIFFRMGSYLGSISVGVIAATTIALLPLVRMPWSGRYLLAGVLFMGALLSGQRGGIVAAMGALVFLLLDERSMTRRAGMIALSAGLALAAVLYLESRVSGTVAYLLHRVVSMADALGERGDMYQEGLRYLADYPLGLGLGAASPAGATGLNIRTEVSDANYLRIVADLGLVGLGVFLLVLGRAGVRALFGPGRPWGVAVAAICVVALGSNVFDTYYLSHMLWLLVGMLGDPPPGTDPAPSAPQTPGAVLEAVG